MKEAAAAVRLARTAGGTMARLMRPLRRLCPWQRVSSAAEKAEVSFGPMLSSFSMQQ